MHPDPKSNTCRCSRGGGGGGGETLWRPAAAAAGFAAPLPAAPPTRVVSSPQALAWRCPTTHTRPANERRRASTVRVLPTPVSPVTMTTSTAAAGPRAGADDDVRAAMV